MIQVEPQGNFFSYLRLWNQFFWQRAAFSVDRDELQRFLGLGIVEGNSFSTRF
jgi:hypothetical protein